MCVVCMIAGVEYLNMMCLNKNLNASKAPNLWLPTTAQEGFLSVISCHRDGS